VAIVATISLNQGLDQPLYAQFPQYPDLMAEKAREQILVRHALSMQMGLEWNENLPYTDPKNSEIAMERAPDRYRFALEQPIREAPGKSWIYSGGAVAILAKLIEQGTGLPLDAYAQQKLFAPLGISSFEWAAGADGVPSAASGLRLTLPDLTKIGEMVAQGGAFNGQQIVPADWLKTAFTPQVTHNQHTKYGYLWYLSGPPNNLVVFGAGNGGQRLTVQPNHDLVVTTFAGRYNDPNGWQTPLKIVLEYAVPAATAMLTR
jgi:CubicO group peptidase (beta-lactamase class C family)